MALAVMSSCSNENDPVVGPQDQDQEAPVAIEMGITTPEVTATTRGAGFIGNATKDGNANWNGEALQILMVKKISDTQNKLERAKYVNADGTTSQTDYIFKDLDFTAPTNTNSGTIKNTAGAVRYFPLTGAYDFFGWHFDNATAVEKGTQNLVDLDAQNQVDGKDSLTYTVTIDGTQDLMIAKAALNESQQTSLSSEVGENKLTQAQADARVYSAWAARRSIQPILTFNHLLARLDFIAKVGQSIEGVSTDTNETIDVSQMKFGENEEAYSTFYPSSEGYPQPATGTNTIANGIYVKSVRVIKPQTTFDVVVANAKYPAQTGIDKKSLDENEPADDAAFVLKQKPESTATDKNMVTLVPVNAGWAKTENDAAGTKVGDGIMIVPGDNLFKMEITLMQFVKIVDKNDATAVDPNGTASSGDEIEDKYEWRSQTITTDVALPTGKVFEAGKFYTINVTVYGFQKIIVTATLSKWQEGGAVDSNPEDDYFDQNNGTTSGGTTTTPVALSISDNDNAHEFAANAASHESGSGATHSITATYDKNANLTVSKGENGDWLTITAGDETTSSDGNSKSKTITFSVTADNSKATKNECVVTITDGKTPITYTVSQAATSGGGI